MLFLFISSPVIFNALFFDCSYQLWLQNIWWYCEPHFFLLAYCYIVTLDLQAPKYSYLSSWNNYTAVKLYTLLIGCIILQHYALKAVCNVNRIVDLLNWGRIWGFLADGFDYPPSENFLHLENSSSYRLFWSGALHQLIAIYILMDFHTRLLSINECSSSL